MEQAVADAFAVIPDGVAVAVELTTQAYHSFLPMVQVNIPGQEEQTVHLVDIDKLLGGIDELSRLGGKADLDIMSRHDEREVIDVVHIVREWTVLGVATVRSRDGDAFQMVVAIDTHGSVDHDAGSSYLC